MMSKKNDKGARVTSPLWLEQRTICTIRVFPHGALKATWLRSSTINRVIGATLGQWGFPWRIAKLKEPPTNG